MKNKKGISLIVLVITIIIIIILAGAVILNLADNNSIENATEAQILSDLDTFNSDLTVQIGQKYIENTMLRAEDIDSDETKEGWKLTDLVPSIKGSIYEECLAVENGKLVLKINTELDEITKEIIENKLGKAVLTKEMILKQANKYIGKEVKYTGYSESTNDDITWRIFNVTEDGTIQLIANSYVDLTYKVAAPATNIVVNGYSIRSSSDRNTLINYLNTESNWSEYAVSGKTTAKGAATIEEFCSSYKLKYPGTYLEYAKTTAGDTTYIKDGDGAVADGYVLRFNEAGGTDSWGYWKDIGTTDDLYIKTGTSYGSNTIYMYWLASPSAYHTSRVVSAGYNGNVSNNTFGNANGGVRPLVSLTSGVLVENDRGELEVK